MLSKLQAPAGRFSGPGAWFLQRARQRRCVSIAGRRAYIVCCKLDLQLKYIKTESDVSPACVAADKNTSWHSMTGGQANP